MPELTSELHLCLRGGSKILDKFIVLRFSEYDDKTVQLEQKHYSPFNLKELVELLEKLKIEQIDKSAVNISGIPKNQISFSFEEIRSFDQNNKIEDVLHNWEKDGWMTAVDIKNKICTLAEEIISLRKMIEKI